MRLRVRTNQLPFLVALVALLVAAAPASARSGAQYRIEGGGWGHGIGMSQFGALGYAEQGWTVQQIVGHYYPGTVLAPRPSDGPTSIRVLVKRGLTTQRYQMLGPGTLHQGLALPLDLAVDDRVEFTREGNLLSVTRVRGAERTVISAPNAADGVIVPAIDGTVKTLFTPDFGPSGTRYRGTVTAYLNNESGAGGGVGTINTVPFESYLRGVVPREISASWHPEAIKAQAVAARSYALRGMLPGRRFDVYATTSSQVYGGMSAEAPQTDAGVQATEGLVARVGDGNGEVAQTFFYSSAGGRTANNEEVWPAAPRSYLRSVVSPYENTHLKVWNSGDAVGYGPMKLELVPSAMGAKLGSYVRGKFRNVTVTNYASGYAKTVTIRGTGGTNTIAADSFKLRHGLGSTNFRVHLLTITAPNAHVRGAVTKITGKAPRSGPTYLRLTRNGKTKQLRVKPNSKGVWTVSTRIAAKTTARVMRGGLKGPAVSIAAPSGASATRR
ncbi:MAG: SpoIID/LytB protein [Thermoleophilia bacterium]|nr:SpoIID/LytB protein [Thermoleophilia bacterium]